MTKDSWLVSAMIGFGKGAQFVMSEGMSFKEAQERAEEVVGLLAQGEWVRIGKVHVNPAMVSTVRVVRERETIRYETVY